jgi:molybdate transport system ATP-binding protein
VSEPATRIRARVERRGFTLDVDLAWDERVAVVFGPSGSGKSTLFEAVLGLHPSAKLSVRLAGRWLDDPGRGRHVPIERRDLGWVPQDPTLFPHLSVEENVRFGARRARRRGADLVARAVEVLEIGELLGRRVDALSGGERQRVAIARAIASGPRALLLDEPLASLDLPLRARVLPYLLRVRDELEIPILHITHDPDEAMLVGERVVVLDGGRAVAEGPPREILWSRAVLPLSEALGIENAFDARVVETTGGSSTVETPGGLRLVIPASAEAGSVVCIGLRAEDVLLAEDRPGRISARNVFEAGVRALEHRGSDVLVHLDAGEPVVAKITAAACEALALRPGARVVAIAKAQALRRLA